MSVLDLVRIVVYRFHEKGLEIFLVNSDLENDPDVWKLPKSAVDASLQNHMNDMIDLSNSEDVQEPIRTVAIEGEWHDIPSIRGLLKHDVKIVKSKFKEAVPDYQKGTFFVLKEAFRKVLPEDYKMLKELKEILNDRNLTKYI